LGLGEAAIPDRLFERLLPARRGFAFGLEELSGRRRLAGGEMRHYDLEGRFQFFSHPPLKPGRHRPWVDLAIAQLADKHRVRVEPFGERAKLLARQGYERIRRIRRGRRRRFALGYVRADGHGVKPVLEMADRAANSRTDNIWIKRRLGRLGHAIAPERVERERNGEFGQL